MSTQTPTANGSYQVYPYFVGTDSACTNAIYLLPPQFTYPQKSPNFSIPLLYNSAYTGKLPTGGYGNTDFQLTMSQQGSGNPTQANVSVSITLLGVNMWKCAQSARATLMSNFVDFIQNIETQFELAGVLIPGATFRIRQQVADWLPAPPLETLFYRYSLSPGFSGGTVPFVDIRPGMRLRLETQTSQFLTPSSPINGYVSTGRFEFFVNSIPTSSGGRVVTFDPFLGTIKSPTISGASTSPVVAGGLIDLQPVSGQRTYWRLFYPQSIPAPSQPGDLTTTDNVMLVGAQSLCQLNSVTNNQLQCNTTGLPSNITVIFLGRVIAVPEIPVWITARGQTLLQYVPLGTTIANLVERYTVLPLNPGQNVATTNRMTTASTSGPTVPVGFYTTGLSAIPSTMFDVPLIAGDSVTLNF
jgi:hypothetical protein